MRILLASLIAIMLCGSAYAGQTRPPASGSGIYAELGEDADFGQCTCEDGMSVGGTESRITFDPNAEYIESDVDGEILFQGVGGSVANVGMTLDIDADNPTLSSSTDTIDIADKVAVMTPVIVDPVNETALLMQGTWNADGVGTPFGNIYAGRFTNTITGSGWSNLVNITAGFFVNFAQTTDGGQTTLKTYGLGIVGAQGISGATYSTGNIWGIDLTIAKAGTSISGDAWGILLNESEVSVVGMQTMIEIEKPTQGATNYQVVLEGDSDGTGVWFGGTGGCRIYQTTTCTDTMIVDGTTKDLCAVCP